jgi:hypothetical protein
MQALPTNALPAAEFLVRHMYRPIEVSAGAQFHAVTEIENAGEDSWFWNDDNAKVLELMSIPEVWNKFPHEAGEILRFVQSMCRGPFIFRRVSQPLLEPAGTEGSITSYRHALMGLKHDEAQGVVTAGVRFHDERNADNLMFARNYIEFTYRGRRYKRDVASAHSKTEAVRDGHLLTLHYSTELHFNPLWQRRRIGLVTYKYIFDARSMLFEVEVALDLDSGIEVSDVVLTIGHDGLGYCFFTNVVADGHPDKLPLFVARRRGTEQIDVAGSTYYMIRQAHISGDALAVHSMPREPRRLSTLEAVIEIPGRFSRVLSRHEFSGRHRGARLVAGEYKLITAGGFYDRVGDYADLMRQAVSAQASQPAAYDFSISYDYGATINAFAKCFAIGKMGLVGSDHPIPTDDLRSRFDETLNHYFELYVDRHEQRPNAMFSRELAFVILGMTTMYRATQSEEYRTRLRRLCDVLLDFEVPFDDGTGYPASSFLMRKDSPRVAYVDCHSASLLALTHASRFIDDARLAAAIDRGLNSYGLETCRMGGGIIDTLCALMIDGEGVRRTENAFWNFKAGLTLRFFAGLRQAENPLLRDIAARHHERMDFLETVLRRQLQQSVKMHDDGTEIRCSVLSAETNSESQPWITLGLVSHPAD